MTKHTATLSSGDTVAYWAHNNDKKKTLVLVHGFTGSHEGFQYLVPLLGEYRLIIPDLPGFGVSPLPHESMTLPHLGEALIDFIESLNLDHPYVLGHSMGSMVVAEAVRQKPEILNKKVILISPVPSAVGVLDTRRAGALVSRAHYAISHRAPVIGKRLATSKSITRLTTNVIMTTKDKKLRETIHGHHFGNLDYISSIGWYRRLHREISRTGINRYRIAFQPFTVLIINGNKDSVTPLGHQKKSARHIGADLVVIPGVGHLSHYEKPLALASAIKSFLTQR